MAIENIMAIATAVVTYIFALITKGEIVESKYIPLQNIIVGILAGVLAYFCGIGDNMFLLIMNCIVGAMSAGGTYDLLQTKNK